MTDLLEGFRSAISDRYAIERELGQGGMGSVYRAFDQTMNRVVAIKERTPAPIWSSRFRRTPDVRRSIHA